MKTITSETAISPMRSSKQIAAEYQVTEQHINRMAVAGKIPGLLVGSDWRFDPIEVRKALEEETTKRRKLKAKH